MEDHSVLYKYFFVSDGKFYTNPLRVSPLPIPINFKFASLYAVTLESITGITGEGSVSGFTGVIWSERLWIDIDCYDKAESVEQRLKEMGLDYVAYDSGSKGAHFGVLRHHRPSHLLHKKDKAWVEQNFPEADRSIYTPLHLFRIPGSVHEATGRKKTFVSESKTGKSVTFENIKVKAIVPLLNVHTGSSLFLDPRFASVVRATNSGERHYTLVKACYALKDKGADINTARWVLEELNKTFREEKEPFEIDKIVAGIFSQP